MAMAIYFVIVAVVSYLMGSFNSAIAVSTTVNNDDIRKYGSHNAGFTNMLRTYGQDEAIMTLIGDVAKSVIAVFLSRLFFIVYVSEELSDVAMFVSTASVVIGHMFPVFYGFRGGKGVLAAASCMLVADRRIFLIVIGVFLVVLLLSRTVSLSSICASVAAIPAVALLSNENFLCWKLGIISVIVVLIVVRHRTNIVRIIKGEENKLSVKKKQK